MTKLYAPSRSALNRKTWCGSYAAAVALTCSYDSAYDMLCRSLRKRRILGMRTAELARGLNELGIETRLGEMSEYYDYVTKPCPWNDNATLMTMKPMTLTQWIKERAEPGVTYIVAAGRHFMTVRDRKIICNQQPTWKSLNQRKGKGSYKRAQVTGFIEVLS
jgi:hypothetical protein